MSEKITIIDPEIEISATMNGNKGGLEALNLEDLRLPQNFADEVGVKRALVSIAVRKPDRQWWVRAHKDPAYRMNTVLLEDRENRTAYLIAPSLIQTVKADATPYSLITAITRQGQLFLWPLKLTPEDGRRNEWNTSMRTAADMATRQWVRVAANMHAGAYDVFVAPGEIDAPEWPTTPFLDLVKLAFRHQYIEVFDHPVLRQLRGEA
jgi:hypothetical protein